MGITDDRCTHPGLHLRDMAVWPRGHGMNIVSQRLTARHVVLSSACRSLASAVVPSWITITRTSRPCIRGDPDRGWLDNAAEDHEMQSPGGDLRVQYDIRVSFNTDRAIKIAALIIGGGTSPTLDAPTDTLRITTEQADKLRLASSNAHNPRHYAFRQMLGFEEYVGHGGTSKQPDSSRPSSRRSIRPGGAR